MATTIDVAIAGGGVIGCSVARALILRYPELRIALFEKEPYLALHQSGRNSGVVHAGYNQKPGSLKSRLVVEGSRRLREFCRDRRIRLDVGGILIVAQTEADLSILRDLDSRGRANGANVSWIAGDRITDIEPHAVGIAALHAPDGGSFDARGYVLELAREAKSRGVQFHSGDRVTGLREAASVEVRTPRHSIDARVFVNAAGLQADRLARHLGAGREYRVVPFRGEYCDLTPQAATLVRSHVYPTPNPAFPFLGVHLSRRVDGRVTAGPGAVLAAGREAYSVTEGNGRDLFEMASWPGFWRMMRTREFAVTAWRECRKTLFKSAVLAEARRLIPGLKRDALGRRWSGIRAQLVSRNGRLVDDLVIEETGRTVHVLNAVSPALTCSLAFAEELVPRIVARL